MSRQTDVKYVLMAGLLLFMAVTVGNHILRDMPADKPATLPANTTPLPKPRPLLYTDRECLARNLAFETLGNSHSRTGVNALLARQEMEAITRVVFRRVELGRSHGYRDSVCEVVYQKGQFSWTYTLPHDTVPTAPGRWRFMLAIADKLLAGKFEHPWPEENRCVTHYKRTDDKGVGKKPALWFSKSTEAVTEYGDHRFSCAKKVLRAAR